MPQIKRCVKRIWYYGKFNMKIQDRAILLASNKPSRRGYLIYMRHHLYWNLVEVPLVCRYGSVCQNDKHPIVTTSSVTASCWHLLSLSWFIYPSHSSLLSLQLTARRVFSSLQCDSPYHSWRQPSHLVSLWRRSSKLMPAPTRSIFHHSGCPLSSGKSIGGIIYLWQTTFSGPIFRSVILIQCMAVTNNDQWYGSIQVGNPPQNL